MPNRKDYQSLSTRLVSVSDHYTAILNPGYTFTPTSFMILLSLAAYADSDGEVERWVTPNQIGMYCNITAHRVRQVLPDLADMDLINSFMPANRQKLYRINHRGVLNMMNDTTETTATEGVQ